VVLVSDEDVVEPDDPAAHIDFDDVNEDAPDAAPEDHDEPEESDEDDEPEEPAEPQTPELMYASVDEWLRRHWRFAYRRSVSKKGSGTGRWRADWWTSDEALQRLEALWRGWEASRQDAGIGTSVWWLNHADPHMAVLLSIDGPFAGSQDETEPGDPLPYLRPPEKMFPPDRQPPGIYDDTVYSRQ
jgi:hypothetical protein